MSFDSIIDGFINLFPTLDILHTFIGFVFLVLIFAGKIIHGLLASLEKKDERIYNIAENQNNNIIGFTKTLAEIRIVLNSFKDKI